MRLTLCDFHARPTMGLGTCPPLSRGVLACPVATHRPEGPTMRLSFWQLRYLHARLTMGLGACPPRGALAGRTSEALDDGFINM